MGMQFEQFLGRLKYRSPRLRAPSVSANIFRIVLGCFLLAVLHIFLQSTRLSISAPPLLQYLATQNQMYSSLLPLDSISIEKHDALKQYIMSQNSEDNYIHPCRPLPHDSQPDLTSHTRDFKEGQLPRNAFDADIIAEQLTATTLTNQLTNNYNSRAERLSMFPAQTLYAGNVHVHNNQLVLNNMEATAVPNSISKDQLMSKTRLMPPLDEHVSPQRNINFTAKERPDWLRDDRDKISILYTDGRAGQFPRRIHDFLASNSRGIDACKLRFFMTWIAPLSGFGPRERLALESVFKTHPSACIVILSRTLDTPEGRHLLDPLVNKGFRVLAITPHLPFLLQSTPAEKWLNDLKEGLIDPGTISIYQNLSNLLRLVILYKYGGVYIDNDIIVMKSFANFSNVIGAQNNDRKTGRWSRLNNAVMVFDKKSPLLLKFIQEFSLTFNGSKWGHNGPYLVSRVVMRNSLNSGCTVLDSSAFYPVDWDHIAGFFRAPHNNVEKQWVRVKMAQLIEHSFAIHLWNKLSRSMDVEPGSIMDSIFQRFCILCDRHTYNTALKGAHA